jgi:hypothetical protein
MFSVKIKKPKPISFNLSKEDLDKYLRALVVGMAPIIKDRIHVQGLKSDETPIGTYSNSYLAHRKKRGKGDDSKVVFSFTRQMQNDFGAVGNDPIKTNNGYGLGFKNDINYNKADWLQNGKRGFGRVYDLTPSEKKFLLEKAEEVAKQLFVNIK